jgi:hypothetical protein
VSLGNTSGCLEKRGSFFGNAFDGAIVGKILFGHVPVRFEVDGTFLAKDEVSFSLNGCTADVRDRSTVGCADVRS